MGKQFGVAGSGLVAEIDFLGEDLELGQEDGGLEGVEAAVDADADVVVFMAPFAVDPEGLYDPRQGVVVGEAHAAVAVAAQGLGREKGGAGDVCQGAGLFTAVTGTEGLGSVFDDE